MSWSDAANRAMAGVKAASGASDAQMGQLLSDMSNWANANANGNHFIPFGKLRNHGVSFSVSNHEIDSVTYGDTR